MKGTIVIFKSSGEELRLVSDFTMDSNGNWFALSILESGDFFPVQSTEVKVKNVKPIGYWIEKIEELKKG